MLKIAFNFFLITLFCSCQYKWGEGLGALQGHYSIGKIRNGSEYIDANRLLSEKLVEGLRRQSRVQLGESAEKGSLIEGRIVGIEKLDLEQSEQGQPTEWQFIIDFELSLSPSQGQVRKVLLSNRDVLSSSGTYRPLENNGQNNFSRQTLNEDQALSMALDDLVQRIMLYLSTNP